VRRWLSIAVAVAACDRSGNSTPPTVQAPAPTPTARPQGPAAGSGGSGSSADAIADLTRPHPSTETATGTTTRLAVTSSGMSDAMDAPDPDTTLELRAAADGQLVVQLHWSEAWQVLAFDVATRTYVLGEIATHGAWRVLDAIRYLDERGGKRDGRFATDHLVALSSRTSPDGSYIALVAQPDQPAVRDGFRLYLLDVAADTLRVLGRAPAPPPLDDPAACTAGPWVWGDLQAVAFYEAMDAVALQFDGGKLRASYGADTCRARAKQRTTQEWAVKL
jgi:hypothetical protein